jgi:hypothetical protein
MRRASLLWALPLVFAADGAHAAIVLVTNLGDAAGVCPGASTCTLRAAIAAAQANDTIEFSSALAFPATLQLSASELTVNKNLVITGPGADSLAIRAAGGARVLALTSGVLELEALTLSHGSLIAANANHQVNGSGANGQSGPTAEGGCLRAGTGTQLVLDRVAVHSCTARGGNGGNGGSGANAFSMAGAGGSGGGGGAAQGGAIYSSGQLTLLQSSVAGSLARGGDGGEGGNGGNAQASGAGNGGGGGNGGVARGGAIYVTTPGALLLRNSTLVDNLATGGNGGDGGNGGTGGGGSGGNGGSGGAARGGQLHLASGVALADLEFASLGASASGGGAAGAPGQGMTADGTAGMAGVLDGELLFTLPSPRIRSSILVGGFAQEDCEGLVTASGNNLDSDDTCSGFSGNANHAAHFFAGQSEGGRAVLRPRPGSPAIDAAGDCLDLAGMAVTADQSGLARPRDGNEDTVFACDLGALEYTPTIFANGFEG